MLHRWILIVPIVALPTYSFAQVQSGLRSGAPLSGVRSGYDYRYNYNYYQPRSYRPAYSNCWRVTRVRGSTIIWNCQPYPPPSP
jgi:hypothetical protein